MKKLISVILATLMVLSCIPFASASSGDVTVTASTPIVIGEDATEQEKFAAERLSYYLGQVFGTAPEITTAATGRCIAIGSAADCDTSALEENGYTVTVDNGCVQIAGTGIRGTIQGVYRFLEEFAGVHNYSADVITAPVCDEITVPADTDIVYAPYFEYCDTDWLSPRNVEYSIANGLNGNTYRSIPSEQGGTVKYLSNFCHTLTTQLCASSKYFEEHPEYFAYHDGERTANQLCLSNPETLKIVISEVLDILDKNYVDDGSLQIISITQNDNQDYCECADCVAFENAHGGVHSATMINFANQIADAVKAAGYDDVAIDTFAYQYTRQAPTGIIPRDNVIVRMCTIEGCFSHTLDDPSCEKNVSLMEDLQDWSEICDRIYIWDYTTNYGNTCCVFPDFGVIQRNIQIFAEHGVKGVYEEGNYYMDRCNTEFGDLRSYMIAKFLQNPYADYDEVVNGFLKAYYGENAAPAMREIIDMYIEHAGSEDTHLGIYYSSEGSLTLTNAQMYQIDDLWEEAKNAEGLTDYQRTNINRSELSWRWYKMLTRRDEFSLINAKRFEEKEKLHDDLVACGVTMKNEGGDSLIESGSYLRYIDPNDWADHAVSDTRVNALNFFGPMLEVFTYFITGFNMMYRIYNSFKGFIKEADFSGC